LLAAHRDFIHHRDCQKAKGQEGHKPSGVLMRVPAERLQQKRRQTVD
jgi:hypothetical protein